MLWIMHDEEQRKGHLAELLKHVRLPLLTPRYLTDNVDSEVHD